MRWMRLRVILVVFTDVYGEGQRAEGVVRQGADEESIVKGQRGMCCLSVGTAPWYAHLFLARITAR